MRISFFISLPRSMSYASEFMFGISGRFIWLFSPDRGSMYEKIKDQLAQMAVCDGQ